MSDQDLPRCDGRCVMGPDVLPGSDPTLVAYPYPDCPAHGWIEPPEPPLMPRQRADRVPRGNDGPGYPDCATCINETMVPDPDCACDPYTPRPCVDADRQSVMPHGYIHCPTCRSSEP